MKKLIGLCLAVVLLGVSTVALAGDTINLETTKFTTPDGKTLDAKSLLAGKKTVIAFAQTACANCRQEIQFLTGAQKDIKDLQVVVAIMDMRPNAERIAGYLGELDFKGPVIIDPKFEFAASVTVNTTPSVVLVGKDGKITFRTAGYDAETSAKITQALK